MKTMVTVFLSIETINTFIPYTGNEGGLLCVISLLNQVVTEYPITLPHAFIT